MAISGPNSPTAPIAPIACPKGVRSSPASRRIGRIVPSAVEHSAMPTTMATSPGNRNHVSPTPRTRLSSHPMTAKRPARPRKAANSISEPATKNSIARPNSESAPTNSDGTAQPSKDGPTRMPSTSSNTTIGMRTQRLMLRANSGASTASSGMTEKRRLELVHGFTIGSGRVGARGNGRRLGAPIGAVCRSETGHRGRRRAQWRATRSSHCISAGSARNATVWCVANGIVR